MLCQSLFKCFCFILSCNLPIFMCSPICDVRTQFSIEATHSPHHWWPNQNGLKMGVLFSLKCVTPPHLPWTNLLCRICLFWIFLRNPNITMLMPRVVSPKSSYFGKSLSFQIKKNVPKTCWKQTPKTYIYLFLFLFRYWFVQ